MRIDHHQPGEVPRATERPAASAGGSSFGRVARRRPALTAAAAPLSIRLHAAARAHNSRVIGDLAASAFRAVAACLRGLAAAWQRQSEAPPAVGARHAHAASALRGLVVHRTKVHSVALGSARDGDDDRSRAARAQDHPRLY